MVTLKTTSAFPAPRSFALLVLAALALGAGLESVSLVLSGASLAVDWP